MTDAQIAELDRKRKEREDELLLLLLLLLGFGVQQGIAETGTASEGIAAAGTPQRSTGADLTGITRLLQTMGVAEIAGSMADAHLDAFAFNQPGMQGAPARESLIRQYAEIARDMVNAMISRLTQAFSEAKTVAEALVLAKYSRSDSRGIEIGVERNIITASNAGVIDGAFTQFGKGGVFGLEHVSVMDDRTTHWCRPRNGLKLAADNPYWLTNWPSLHAGCRSAIVPLTKPFTDMSGFIPMFDPPDVGYGIAPASVLPLLRRRTA